MLYFTTNDGEKKVFFKHLHESVPADPRKEGSKPHKRPRHTFCSIVADEKTLGTGQSSCCPLDTFSYVTGRKRAFAEALKAAQLSREDRKAAWEAFHNKGLGGI